MAKTTAKSLQPQAAIQRSSSSSENQRSQVREHSKYGISSLNGRKTPQIDRMLALMKDRQRRIRHESMLHFLKAVLLWQAVVGVSLFFLRWLVLRLSSIILPAFYLLKNTLIWKEGCLFKHAKKLYCSRLFVGNLELPRLQKSMLLISLPLKYFIISSCNTLVHYYFIEITLCAFITK